MDSAVVLLSSGLDSTFNLYKAREKFSVRLALTFNYGQRKHCEAAVTDRGATAGGLTQKTNVLVIGMYATDSWKHSSFGTKIMSAVEYRKKGLPISIVSEEHWVAHL